MYHGDKEQVYDFLRKEVEMAEDGQAIYEFVQNAADSNSTKFYMFYDENYLIVINNGDVFSKEGIKSILNIGQSYGKENTDKIGRYGIGFKLVHRLVGKSSGLDELLNVDNQGYRGPILFSWSEKSQFNDFLNSNEFEYVDFGDKSAPWLLKILITNFPVESKEKVKDIDFNEIEPFQLEELKSFQIFLNSCIDKIDLNSLNSGSIFFLKLGDKKFDYLEKQQNEYLNGLSTSMHFLKSLETLTINETVIKRDEDATNVLEFTVKNGSDDFNQIGLSEIRDKESDAKFKICFADNVNSANEIKKHPNIYKYFPAVKEVNNLSFVIHSNLFELSSNRQNLTETPINKKLLGLLSNQIINLLENFKIVDRNKFKSLFTSILMSDESSNESSGNGWQSEYFYNKLLEYIREVIPTKGNEFADNAQNVKINKLKRIELNLSDFGLFQIKWFEWDKNADKLLIEAAKKEEKLRIEEWDIRDVIENSDLDSINKWIANCDKKLYEGFLKELENSALRTKTKERICQIKLFKFSNHKFYSFNDLIVKRLYAHNTISKINSVFKYNFSNVFFKTDKNEEIAKELNKLGIILSTLNISKYPSIFSSIEKIPDENDIYLHIAEKCKTNNLNPSEKKKIFLNFINDETKLNNVVKETLNELQLFSDNKSDIMPLNKLIGNIKTPSWLNIYKIKQEEYFSELDTFLLTESKDLFNNVYLQNKEDIISNVTTTAEITSLIELYQVNQKSFFKEFIIKKVKNEFIIIEKTNGNYQVFSADKEARKFIDENCKENLFVLPNEFKEKCRNEEGIIKAEDLHNLILDYIIADDHKELLCDFIGNKAKHKFLLELSEFRFSEERKYTKDDYEYKILEIACSELKEIDYKNFQKKVIIEAKNSFLKLSQIPPITDKIKIDNYDLSLSKILPKNYENSDLLGNLIFQFIDLGLNKDRIKSLFGVSEETEPSEIFQMFSEQLEIIDNADQLVFIFLYGLFIDEIEFNKFSVLNEVGDEVKLGTDKYLTYFSFLEQSKILHSKYRSAAKIFKTFPVTIEDNDNLLLIKEPYFANNKFNCPYIKENLSEDQKLDFIEFLYNEWDKKNAKTAIKNLDWSKIDNKETITILDFNPITSVYPSKYANESEGLPKYLLKWLQKDENKIDFISDLGVSTEDSVIVQLRKFLSGKTIDFQNYLLSQESRFKSDEKLLFNSFEWLKENKLRISTQLQYVTFKKVVEIINKIREIENIGDLQIQDKYDFVLLREKSTEWDEMYYETWKEESNIAIFLYEYELPTTISLNEIEDYVFYSFYEANIAFDEKNNIFINQNADVKKELRKLELVKDSYFNFDGLWQNKLEVLENENARLRKIGGIILESAFETEDEAEFVQFYKEGYTKIKAHWRSLPNRNELSFNDYFLRTIQSEIQNYKSITVGTEYSNDLSKNDQKEINREAKVIVKEKLESEGFEFTNGIDEFSTINGVKKEGIEYPLVVKSYKNQDEPLKIGANEWIQLMHPNSMFWVYFGNDKIACLKLNELLRKQDNLTISFSTENLDVENRLEKFAELLRYFGNVHFDFHSVKPNNYSTAAVMGNYQFDERKTEEDLSSDDQDIL